MRRRRQFGSDAIAMTDVMTVTVPYNVAGEINLMDLQPIYQYVVNVSIGTAYGATPSVPVLLPPLAAAGNIINA